MKKLALLFLGNVLLSTSIVAQDLFNEDFDTPVSVSSWVIEDGPGTIDWVDTLGDPDLGALQIATSSSSAVDANSPCFTFDPSSEWTLFAKTYREVGTGCLVGYKLYDTATCDQEILELYPDSPSPPDVWTSHSVAVFTADLPVNGMRVGGRTDSLNGCVVDNFSVQRVVGQGIPALGGGGLVGLVLLLGLLGVRSLR